MEVASHRKAGEGDGSRSGGGGPLPAGARRRRCGVPHQADRHQASGPADCAGFSFAEPDYSQQNFTGISAYAVYDFTPHYGVELMFHQVDTRGDDQIYERTYEIGPRYVRHFGRFDPFVRPAYGRGVFNYPNGVANLAYNMFTIAGGVDVHVQRHVNVRAEYEAQHWLSFPPNGLSPQVITFGAAYHF